MLAWLLGAGGVLLATILWANHRRELRPARALPPSPLVERLSPVLAAVGAIRASAASLSANDLMLCARASPRPSAGPEPWLFADLPRQRKGVGPGLRLFLDLLAALERVDEDDRRTLAESGFDLARLEGALRPSSPADAWRQQLLRSFDALETALARAPHHPYR